MAQRAEAALAVQVTPPDRPRRAAGVRLGGKLEDSAFERQQWLAEVDGQFIQLSELLYRIAEKADGNRTVEDLSRDLSQGDRAVSPMIVRSLLLKLIPLGIIVNGDGNILKPDPRLRGPLALNMKMAMFGPGVVNAMTGLFRWLYLPPAIVVVLIATIAAHVWLYGAHGIAAGLHDALYAPALLLAVLGGIIVSAAFHELGHGAALRYGGGRVRAMGVGLYLIYPAFYTDVTDGYRLGRGARLRTDLGGFYFNALFFLASVAAYALTGQEFLLVIALAVDVEVVQQLLPVVRVDGYWILADLTGIPDFFSQMAAFIRTTVPGLGRSRGARMAELRWWAKLVFALYILIVIPVLAVLLFLAARGLPRLIVTAADSFAKQAEALVRAYGAGDGLAIAAAVVQMIILVLPVLGLVSVLATVLSSWIRFLRRWSTGSARKRMVAGFLSAATLFGVALLWLPQLPGLPVSGAALAGDSTTPISTQERGTVVEAVSAIFPLFGPPGAGNQPYAPSASPSPSAGPSASSPAGSATAQPSGQTSAQPSSQPSASAPPSVAPSPAPTLGTP